MLLNTERSSTAAVGSIQAEQPAFLRERMDGYFRERVEKTWSGGHIMKGRRPGSHAVMLVSNDYLDFANHPAIMEAQVEVLRSRGHGLLRSGVFRNGMDPLRRFELALAQSIGCEDTVVCQSGWCANTGLIQSITGPATPVYIDMFAHMSLWEGITAAGALARPFKHNDPVSLEHMAAKHGPGVVIVDAVYSTSGSIAPLAELVAVAERHGCVLVVDESHALGVFGEHGEGLTAALGLSERVHFRTASLSKAFAARGGVVAGSARHMEYFRYESRPAIFSSCVLDHEAAGFLATLEVMRAENDRRSALHANADYLRGRLSALDYNVDDSQCQIISLVAGPEPQTMILRDALETRGVFGSVFCAPATAKNRSLVRFTVTSGMTREQLERVVAVCATIREEVGLYEWASTRKKGVRRAAASVA
ncbi:MAG: quorum-sensing autoinducer CAI-1 synthase [Candidatus Lambdaproteobacteria bacterium]|nr:quorum-sensing autoinducer CAI-1 synthase [Candidatus Lambdaproteobacteria bacterium]